MPSYSLYGGFTPEGIVGGASLKDLLSHIFFIGYIPPTTMPIREVLDRQNCERDEQ